MRTRFRNLRELELAEKRLRNAIRNRNAAILEAHEAGASLRGIALAVGLSPETVRKIIKREQTRLRPPPPYTWAASNLGDVVRKERAIARETAHKGG